MLILSRFLVIVTVFFFSNLAVQAKDADIKDMMSTIEQKMSTTKSKQQAIRMGKERAVLCMQCHGEDGNSTKLDVPNLASQNPVYLLNQIEKFADGRRKNYVMNALSKNFSRDDKENLAVFYASMKAKASITNIQLANKGQAIYINQCGSCHGKQGAGKSDYARLAGQKTHYVEMTLRNFRDGLKSSSKRANRKNSIMELIAKELSDDDVEALAAYVAQLE